MPGAAYIVSIMSSMNFCTPASMSRTGCVGTRSTSSPYLRIGRTGTSLSGALLQILDHRFDGVVRALLVEVVENFPDAGMFGEGVVEFFLVEAKQLGRLRCSDRRGA